jgi:hypothetical protein
MVIKPKLKGGLNVINLNVQNDAHLLKHLNKFYNRKDIPWVSLIWNIYYDGKVSHGTREVGSFWWKDVQRLNTIFRGIARCTIGDGTTLTFWEDLWTDEILAHRFPRLYSFARNSSISVNEVLSAEDLDSLFWLPLSQEAFDELQSLQDVLMTQTFDEQTKDVWLCQWGNATYSSRMLYKLAFQNVPAHPIFAWL